MADIDGGQTAADLAEISDAKLYGRFEGAHRLVYWIACLQRGPTGIFRQALTELRERALRERDLVGAELARRRAASADYVQDVAERTRRQWLPSP